MTIVPETAEQALRLPSSLRAASRRRSSHRRRPVRPRARADGRQGSTLTSLVTANRSRHSCDGSGSPSISVRVQLAAAGWSNMPVSSTTSPSGIRSGCSPDGSRFSTNESAMSGGGPFSTGSTSRRGLPLPRKNHSGEASPRSDPRSSAWSRPPTVRPMARWCRHSPPSMAVATSQRVTANDPPAPSHCTLRGRRHTARRTRC